MNKSQTDNIAILLLTILFTLMLAQFLQYIYPISALPGIKSWSNQLIPYGLEVSLKILILGFFSRLIITLRTGKLGTLKKLSVLLLSAGCLYFCSINILIYMYKDAYTSTSSLHFFFRNLFHVLSVLLLIILGVNIKLSQSQMQSDLKQKVTLKEIAQYLLYPSSIAIGLVIYQILLDRFNPSLASYLTAVLFALIITFLEKYLPYRKNWVASLNDVKVDLIFMISIQILIPVLLTLVSVFGFIMIVEKFQMSMNLFPTHWFWGYQVILMLIWGEFFRYFLHRSAHTWMLLWNIHAVHHSPGKLYWLNVGRFHPLEKIIQFLVEGLPFIFLGVTKDVMGYYFVFYAINGFYQHSNVDIRLGYLNYIIAGAQIHRWHHSKIPKESNNNYGNNLIVWDVIFGTRFYPQDREVEALGLRESDYPKTFFNLMKIPFKRNKS